jgi:hypothetical protein
MKIIAFIHDSKAIADIMRNRGIPAQDMPPPITSPPVLEQTDIWTDLDFAQAESIIELENSGNDFQPDHPQDQTSGKLPAVITADELLKKSES